MTSNALGLLLLNGLFLAGGAGITAAIGWWRAGAGSIRPFGMAYLVGVATYGVVAQLLYVCGASLATWQVVVVAAAPTLGLLRLRAGRPPTPVRRSRWRFIAVPVGAMLVLLAVDLWFQPLWAYDAWTFWTPKAHALWALDGLRPSWFGAADLSNKDYPILLPSVEAAGFRFTGYETSLLDVQSLFFFAAFLRAVYEISAARAKPAVLWAVLALLVLAPSVANQLASAEADIPVAVFFASAGMAGAVWLRDRRPEALVVACILAAGASATKVEGLIFCLALFAALAVGAGSRSRAAQALLWGGLAIGFGAAPWRIWMSRHGVPPSQSSLTRLTDLSFLIRHGTRVPLSGGYMLVKMVDPRAWLLTMPLFGFVIWRASMQRDRTLVAFVALAASLSFLGLILAYWSTRLGFHYQLATAARRVVTGVVFFCAAATPILSEKA